MDDVGRCILWFLITVIFTAFASLFSAANEAYDDAGVSRLRKLFEEEDNKKAEKLLSLQCPVQPYSLRMNLCGGTALLVAAVSLYLSLSGITQVWWHLLIGMAVGLLLILFFGMGLPRVLAESNPTGFILRCCGLLRIATVVFSPFAEPVMRIAAAFDKRSEEPDEEDDRTEEEIRLLVDAGTDSGAIEASENEMIDNIFEFDDRTVGEVMTHRTDVFAVEEHDGLEDILDIAIKEGVSRIPVYRDRIDHILGVVYVKDLLLLLAEQKEFRLEEFIRPVLYTPEQTMCNTLFREFNAKNLHFAVVIDEYGGTAGIVTMEDLLEAIVGNIQDEYDHEEVMVHPQEDGSFRLNGDLEIAEVEKLLDITIPDAEDGDTIGGVVINALQRIPEEGETPQVELEDWILRVVCVKERHIEEIYACKKQEEQA